jgi:hypothetical protein
MDRDKLAQTIRESVIALAEQDLLLRRLKIASHDGVAAVVRDYQIEVEKCRTKVLQSHRRYWHGQSPSPRDKKMVTLCTI